ncbi:DUF58 domain-containing protein [Akkermansiaceae bacterium]|nr:DUF58 domain-containing protein [Akkermansiaceae bacterium]
MSARFRILHLFYHRGAALQHWFGRRIRPAGAGAMVIVSIGSFMSVGQPRNSIFQIFCFSLGMVAISLVWVLFRRAKLSASLDLPRHATAGEPLRYTVRLENTGRRTLRGAKLGQTGPDPRPGLREFAAVSEPGEHERNLFDRTMVYYRWQWLMARKAGFRATESEETLELAPGERRKVAMHLTPIRRGIIPMGDLRALLPDPLGFFQKCRSIETKPARLVVLPKRHRLPQFVMPGSAAFRIGGEETSNAIGSAGEFVGLRDYRPGDPLRQIHWKSWAHTGRPMVKELEDNFFPRYALVLDTFAGSPDESVFEEMVSVAASFIVGLDRSESLLDLMFIAGEAHTVTAGRGMERAEKLLEVLAGVGMEDDEHLDLLAASVIRHREKMTSCLIILNGWDGHRSEFLGKLIKAGIPCVPLVVGNGPSPPGVIGHWLENGHVARDLMHLPAGLSAAT